MASLPSLGGDDPFSDLQAPRRAGGWQPRERRTRGPRAAAPSSAGLTLEPAEAEDAGGTSPASGTSRAGGHVIGEPGKVRKWDDMGSTYVWSGEETWGESAQGKREEDGKYQQNKGKGKGKKKRGK